tara:strand:- start:597 stop:1811 length:1215 start_codon:yes stop_codon:yes gene_type:complete
MFTGFPSTQTPAVQWWDFSKLVTGTNSIALANDCAPVQYFATGGSTTTILIYLPPNPAQGKTITFKNDSWRSSGPQAIQIKDPNGNIAGINTSSTIGVGGSITYCYISQNTLSAQFTSNWIIISPGSSHAPLNQFSVSLGTNNNATGTNSAAIGGLNNSASAQAGCFGGDSNIASGSMSATLGGQSSTASGGNSAILGGNSNTASATYTAVIGGTGNTASVQSAIVLGGQSNVASGLRSATIGASNGTTRGISGNIVIGSSESILNFTVGAQQLAMIVLAKKTTNATATVLCSDSSSASSNNQVILPNNSAYYFRGECVAGVTGAGDTKGWYIEGVIKRGANAASTVLVGTPSVTSLYADAGAATWNLTATADVTNGGLAITATGQAATTIQWVVQMRTTEMTY